MMRPPHPPADGLVWVQVDPFDEAAADAYLDEVVETARADLEPQLRNEGFNAEQVKRALESNGSLVERTGPRGTRQDEAPPASLKEHAPYMRSWFRRSARWLLRLVTAPGVLDVFLTVVLALAGVARG